MAIKHRFASAKPDGVDQSFVQPSKWNEDHQIDDATITLAQLASLSATQRVIGRRGAGAGPAEEISAGQLLDWVSSENGVLLTRSSGTWGRLANVGAHEGDLVFDDTLPSTPLPGKVKVYGASSAGRCLLGQRAAAGASMLTQPFLGQQRIGGWWPAGLGTTTTTVIGITAPTALGTPVGRAPTATNSFTAARRLGVASSAGAGSVAGLRSPSAYLFRQFGHHVVYRFGISDAVIATTGRMFVGLAAAATAPTDVEPSSLTNVVGVGVDAGDATLRVYAAGAAAQPGVLLGSNFPANTTNVDVYELALYCAPAGNISYQLTRVNTGDVAFGLVSAAASLPTPTTMLANQMWRSNGATAGACAIDLFSMYVETDI